MHPASGRDPEPFIPRVGTAGMSAASEQCARWANPDGSKTIMLPAGNAGWRVAKGSVVPPGILPRRLPPGTPGLQRVGPPWPRVREAVAGRGFTDLDEMEPVLVDRCRWLIDHPETVRGAVGFAWAPPSMVSNQQNSV